MKNSYHTSKYNNVRDDLKRKTDDRHEEYSNKSQRTNEGNRHHQNNIPNNMTAPSKHQYSVIGRASKAAKGEFLLDSNWVDHTLKVLNTEQL